MLFDPRESIDFNGNTGPFIQYTHARIRSVLRKAEEAGIDFRTQDEAAALLPEEIELIKALTEYPATVQAAAANFAPSIVALTPTNWPNRSTATTTTIRSSKRSVRRPATCGCAWPNRWPARSVWPWRCSESTYRSGCN